MMGGQTSTNQAQQQQSTTNPWGPTYPILKNIIGQAGGGNLAPTAGQTSATAGLVDATTGLPNFGSQGAGAVNNLFNANTNPQQGILNNSYSLESGMLSPMMTSGYTNPYTNPAFSSAMGTMNSDISNQIEGQAAAAGRPVGTNASETQALARGLSQGEGQLMANEFNTLTGNQLAAGSQLGGAAGNTAGGLTAAQQAALNAQTEGIGAAGSINGLFTAPAMGQLAGANAQAQLPWTNLGAAEGVVNPIAALGGQSTGSSTGQTTQQQPWPQSVVGAGLGGMGMLGASGAFGTAAAPGGWLGGLGSMLGSGGSGALSMVPLMARKGGVVPRSASPSGGMLADDVPTMLSAGEMVIPRGKVHHARRIGMLADLAA